MRTKSLQSALSELDAALDELERLDIDDLPDAEVLDLLRRIDPLTALLEAQLANLIGLAYRRSVGTATQAA